jgi:hypothetical protein
LSATFRVGEQIVHQAGGPAHDALDFLVALEDGHAVLAILEHSLKGGYMI